MRGARGGPVRPAPRTARAPTRTGTDPVRAAELYRRVDHRVTDGAYYLPVVADKALNYRGPRLTNVYVHQAYGMVDFQALGLADGK
ncbi:hypothetical protein [Streptomyces sp. NPDC057413]|uniref:hypothetical protein n=1 Tax=Streptomyces sp. NPDC057413 TaxID=3346124 RepID=UPI0036C33376